jgi:hypothetical protein
MKTMKIRNWIYLGLGGVLGAWMASCGGGTFCHAQQTLIHVPLPPGTTLNHSGTLIRDFTGVVVTYYSPETNLETFDVARLGAAKETVDLAAFSLTDAAIVNALVADAGRGVKIRIYLDRGELQAECRGDATCARIPLHNLLDLPGVTVKVKFSKVLMHLKSYEIDGMLVRDGSANFSEQGESRQDNSATFTSDLIAAAAFETKFEEIWARADNLTVAEGIKAK